MDKQLIRHSVAQAFAEAEKLERDVVRHKAEWNSWTHSTQTNPPDWLIEEDDTLIKPFRYYLESIYISTVCLLDAEGLSEYLRLFLRTFGRQPDTDKWASEFDIDFVGTGDGYNTFLASIRHFLQPINVLKGDNRLLAATGVHYLEVLLRSTGTIIHDSKAVPRSEADVSTPSRNTLLLSFHQH